MEKKAVKPREGYILRDPVNYSIVTHGYIVDIKDPFWQRRLKAGDIEIIGEAKKEEPKKEEPKKVEKKEEPKKLSKKKKGDK